ncbi:MAG: hypothetical protein U1A27_10560 [Phycisphaerae bacterium]
MAVEESCICSSCFRELADSSARCCEHCGAACCESHAPVPLRCVACGYCLTGVVDPRCPECGRIIDRKQIVEAYGDLVVPMARSTALACLIGPPVLGAIAMVLMAGAPFSAATAVALPLLFMGLAGAVVSGMALAPQVVMRYFAWRGRPYERPSNHAAFGLFVFVVIVGSQFLFMGICAACMLCM